MDGQNKKRVVDAEKKAFSGITLAYV
jgi:hypothetical protein